MLPRPRHAASAQWCVPEHEGILMTHPTTSMLHPPAELRKLLSKVPEARPSPRATRQRSRRRGISAGRRWSARTDAGLGHRDRPCTGSITGRVRRWPPGAVSPTPHHVLADTPDGVAPGCLGMCGPMEHGALGAGGRAVARRRCRRRLSQTRSPARCGTPSHAVDPAVPRSRRLRRRHRHPALDRGR